MTVVFVLLAAAIARLLEATEGDPGVTVGAALGLLAGGAALSPLGGVVWALTGGAVFAVVVGAGPRMWYHQFATGRFVEVRAVPYTVTEERGLRPVGGLSRGAGGAGRLPRRRLAPGDQPQRPRRSQAPAGPPRRFLRDRRAGVRGQRQPVRCGAVPRRRPPRQPRLCARPGRRHRPRDARPAGRRHRPRHPHPGLAAPAPWFLPKVSAKPRSPPMTPPTRPAVPPTGGGSQRDIAHAPASTAIDARSTTKQNARDVTR
ncbi:hypothetical protein SAMN05443668_106211 [Cryptosporangium aurantiacum]|uniref:Uncharacterized protein n=1 Tax=Cryptosporangium aurantiacum TaxID=134849 RepID=A0A1M7R3A5_9ACTN|nr:hypothetical protein SAMN05443668_106211 [Cryptosporangium aurantiacum]